MLFGRTVGTSSSRYIDVEKSQLRRLHSVESLTELLKSHGFEDVSITRQEIDMPTTERISPTAQKQLDSDSFKNKKTLMLSFKARLGEFMSPKKYAMINPKSPSARPIIAL